MQVRIEARNVTKTFNRRTIFREVTFSVDAGQTMLISGKNGSGKSTLVKIIVRLLTPTKGTINITGTGKKDGGYEPGLFGLVSPYLQLYEEFSAVENLRLALAIRGLTVEIGRINALLTRVNLFARKDDPVRTYSSGMKQRAKYAFALVHHPSILVLDEPMANLDTEGIAIVRSIMDEHRIAGTLIVATNDLTDIDRHDVSVDLNG